MFKLKFRPDTDHDAILKDLLLHPLAYLRILAIICSSVVFGCVVDKLYVGNQCFFNDNVNCCKLAIAVGVIGFVVSLMFLVKDVLYNAVDFTDNFRFKVLMLLIDVAVHVPTGLLWFASFSFSADQWRKTPDKNLFPINYSNAVVAFSFFCTLLWSERLYAKLRLLSSLTLSIPYVRFPRNLAIVVMNVILMIRLMLKRGTHSRGYASFPEVTDSVHPDGTSAS